MDRSIEFAGSHLTHITYSLCVPGAKWGGTGRTDPHNLSFLYFNFWIYV